MQKKRNRSIRAKDWCEIRSKPCAVCGIPYNIHCDHIIPFSKGGSNRRENLQPLCGDCNNKKTNRKTNEELREIIKSVGLKHFTWAIYLYDTKHYSYYDGPCEEEWFDKHPDRLQYAVDLWKKFVSGTK